MSVLSNSVKYSCPAHATRSKGKHLVGLPTVETHRGSLSSVNSNSTRARSMATERQWACPPFSEKFDGVLKKDGATFIADFDNYGRHYRCTAEQCVRLLPLSLESLAKDWVNTKCPKLENETFEDFWPRLKESFAARFCINAEDALLGERMLSFRVQKPTETLTAYVDNLQLAARLCPSVTEHQLVRIIIGGLRTDVRSHVLLQNPQTISDLYVMAGKLSTATNMLFQGTPTGITSTPANHAMPILNSVATVSHPPSTLQSIATILFGSDGQLQQQMTDAVPRTPAPVCSVNQYSQPHTLDTISTRLDNITEVLATNITALTERMDSLGRSQPPREMSRSHHQMQRSHHQMQRPHKRQQQPTPLCSRCGDNRCNGEPDSCRARGQTCYNCHGANHFSKVCYSKSGYGHRNNRY